MQGGRVLRSRLAGVVLAAMLVPVVFTAAVAQEPAQSQKDQKQDAKRDELGVSVTFGWQGQMPTERWAPITASISAGDSSIAGNLVAEYEQDATNLSRFSAPFATTPGAAMQVQVFVSLPYQCVHLKLMVVGDSGKTLWAQNYTLGGTPPNLPLPTLIGPETPVVAVVGRSFVPQAIKDWPGIAAHPGYADSSSGQVVPRRPLAEVGWTYATGVRADVDALPTTWMGYDAIAALVVVPEPERPPDPRAVEAIHRWVESGGRLVVQADAPGDGWRAWVPRDWGVEPGAARRGPVPEGAAEVISALARRLAVIREKDAEAGAPPTSGTAGELPVRAQTTMMRPLRAPPGWESLWPVGDAGGESLVVRGQHGFGTITLVGFDPVKATEMASAVAAGAVWREVLAPVMADALERAAAPYDERYRYGYGYAITTSQSIVNTGLERLARVPGLGDSVMIAILACIFALAGLVGPLDYFLLRRLRALQRSWVTALAWVVIASVGAMVGPRLIRAEPTRVNRVSVEDCVALPMSGGAASGVPRAFRSGLTGVYAGDAGVAKFASPDPASWWRGVSAQNEMILNTAKGTALVPVVQRAAGGESGSERGCALTDLPIALWTFRTFADESAPAASIRARVREMSEGWSVLVAGLPSKARIVNAALRVDGRWVTLNREARAKDEAGEAALPEAPAPSRSDDLTRAGLGALDDGVWTAVFPTKFADAKPPRLWSMRDYMMARYSYGPGPADTRPGLMLGLNGPAKRGQAIDRAVAAGWGAVYLEVADWPVDTTLTWPSQGEQTRVLRVLVPVGGD